MVESTQVSLFLVPAFLIFFLRILSRLVKGDRLLIQSCKKETSPHCSDEEGYGKFLDLHECYDKYINIKGVERVDYIGYIQAFEKLADIPKVFLADGRSTGTVPSEPG
jgi:hypothetical protein